MTENHNRRSFLTYERVGIWLLLGGIVYTAFSFYSASKGLPERVSVLEIRLTEHCAAQVQYQADLQESVKEMKGMIRDLWNDRRK